MKNNTLPGLSLLAAAALMTPILLTGCNQTQSQIFRKPGTIAMAGPAGVPPAPNGAVPAAGATQPKAPYVLSAKSGGPFVDFSIYNLGDTDLPVKPEDFAIISPEGRDVVPYSREGAVIDLPQPAVVKPGETLSGRAVFRNITNPSGKRLVFKPDTMGTFADISR